ncbi:MAG: glycosyltransferase [Saprospiraceae bacterium]|nr:glycosyltransferase [Saprospiraceae bacterium]
MRKTKVVFFTDMLIEGYDGAQRTMFHLISRIPKDQYTYFFICGERPTQPFAFELMDIPSITIPFNDDYSLAMPALAYFKMKKALDRFRPDVIHIASPSLLGNFALEYAEARSIPVISIYHTHFISYVDYYLNGTPIISDLARSSVVSGQRKFYDRCDYVLVPTMALISELISHGFNQEKLHLWQRGIDHAVFNPGKMDSSAIQSITGSDKFTILIACRHVWEKNMALLIELYTKYLKDEKDICLVIAGDGIARTEMESKMEGAIFLGSVDQDYLAMLYASSDLFLFPSTSETYGSVVVEAMSCGCPCIVANGGGSQSFITDGTNGFTCNVTDPDDFYKKIVLLKNDTLLREHFIKEGLVYTNSLNWDKIANQYFKIVDECAGRPVLY